MQAQQIDYEIFTFGAGVFLEKIFNAIRLIIADGTSYYFILKISAMLAILIALTRAGMDSDWKSFVKWFAGVTVFAALFFTHKVTVAIVDKLPVAVNVVVAPRVVEGVPFGLAVIGSVTSGVGNYLGERFEAAFAGVFNNSEYQKTGVLFGSKIVEDASKFRMQDTALKHFMLNFYKRCIVPDVMMGYNRKNGYTVRDLVEADNILEFLKDHSSNARMVHFNGELRKKETDKTSQPTEKTESVNDYITCNQAAHHIANKLDYEIDQRMPKMASGFFSFFFHDQGAIDKSEIFKAVLQNSYGIFIKKKANEAKEILLQNVMINSIDDTASSFNDAYGKVATEAIWYSAGKSVGEVAMKFIPLLRAVFECMFYGCFPLILVLMMGPQGLDKLKGYIAGFIYLQLWQPLFAILFCMCGALGYWQAGEVDSLTFATHLKISKINQDISMVAGMLLASIPIIAGMVLKGMMAGMGNLTSSILYIPQTAAVHNAEQGIKGNYQLGTSSIGTHSYNNTSANKHDDNYSWVSGMQSFGMASGAVERSFSDGRAGIDSSSAISNLAGLAKVDWGKAMGTKLDLSEREAISSYNRSSSNMIESQAAGYSKMLGFTDGFNQNSKGYQNWQNQLSTDDRQAVDDTRGFVHNLAQRHGLTDQDALRIAIAANAGINIGKNANVGGIAGSISAGLGASVDAYKNVAIENAFNEAREATKNTNFSQALSRVQNAAKSSTFHLEDALSKDFSDRIQSDFASSHSASREMSRSMESLKSIEVARGAYENQSSAINQDLSNKFSEWGIGRYGATQFENIIRDNPVKTNDLLNEFIDQRGLNYVASSNMGNKFDDFTAKANSAVEDSFVQNSNVVANQRQHNDDKFNYLSHIPPKFKEEVGSNVKVHESLVSQTDTRLIGNNNAIQQQKEQLDRERKITEEKVAAENKKTATGKMIDKFTE